MHASTADIDIPLLVGARRAVGLATEVEVSSNLNSHPSTRVSVDQEYQDNVSDYFVHRPRYLSHALKLYHDVRPYEGLLFVPLSVFEMLLMKYIGEIAGSVYKSLVNLDEPAFRKTLFHALALYGMYIVLTTISEWMRGMISVVWRSRLSVAMHDAYFRNQSFGSVCSKLDNCDQRLTSEISGICLKLPIIVQKISASPLKLLFYGYLTSRYTGFLSIIFVTVFFTASILLQKLVTIPLARELVQLEQCEGYYRSSHMRIKNASVDIALQSGQMAETNEIDRCFDTVLQSQRMIVFRRACVVGVTKLVDYSGALLNYMLIAMAIFLGKRGGAAGDGAEFISNASFFTLTFIFTLTEIVDLSQNVSEVLSLVCRVYGLSDMLVDAEVSSITQQCIAEQDTGIQKEFSVFMPPSLFESKQGNRVMEISILVLEGELLDNVRAIFPSGSLTYEKSITCCMTLQPRQGPDLESMDMCLNEYLDWERSIIGILGRQSWCDSIDPKTGKALRGPAGNSWSEVHAFSTLLNYNIHQGDVCPFILHPKYGSEAYPVTFFTTASPAECKRALEAMGNLSRCSEDNNNTILQIKGATITSPSLQPLLVDLHIGIQTKKHVLVTGPNGSGKTTLLRYICRCLQNQNKRVTYMYLPQVPIVAPGKHFWQQIAYPSDCIPPQQDMLNALQRSGMLKFYESLSEGFQTIDDWDACLSFGQKQRICLSRVFLHKPALAILDESTTGMDTSSAVDVMTNVQEISTCITVTHNPDAFRSMFSMELLIGGSSEGNALGWQLTSLEQ